MIHTQHARLVDMLLMCAVRIAFIEDNINLTLNFHLIFFFPPSSSSSSPSFLRAHTGLSVHWAAFPFLFFFPALKPPNLNYYFFQVTYCPLVTERRITRINQRLSDEEGSSGRICCVLETRQTQHARHGIRKMHD